MGRTLRGSVTIGEVATAAGVSRATVSRVMNDRSTVEPTMARRVRAAAEELRYRPSSVARSLSLGRTNSVAFVVPDLSNPMFQQILRGTMAAAAPHDYRMLVAESPEKPEDEAESALEARLRCDALVLVSPRMTDDALRDLLPQVRPAVLVNRCINESSTPALMVDYATGIAEIIDHVMALGHRDLVYLSGPSHSTSNAARIIGIRSSPSARCEGDQQSTPDTQRQTGCSQAARPRSLPSMTSSRSGCWRDSTSTASRSPKISPSWGSMTSN
jgi:LacI family transcriptional regulator